MRKTSSNIPNPPDKKISRKAAAAAAGIAAACSLAVASIAPAPAELFSGAKQPPAAQVALKNDRSARKAVPPLAERLRALFLKQPSVVRGLVLLPFWAVGKALLTLASALISAFAPVWQILLGVLLNALLLFGLFALVYKLLFPNKKLRDLLTKRNIFLLAGGSLLLAAADAILRAFWEDYRPVSLAVKLVLALGVLILLSWRIFGKRAPQAKPA